MSEDKYDTVGEDPIPLLSDKVPPPPVECLEPRIHPEVVQHGAALAGLAIQLSQRKKDGKPMDYLQEARELLEAAMRMVAVENISRLAPFQRSDYLQELGKAERGEEEYVPWKWVCEEGASRAKVKPKLLRLEIDGKTQDYNWVPYVQSGSKRGGVRDLFLKHARRVGFEKPEQKNVIKQFRTMLEDPEFNEKRIASVLSAGGLEWTAEILKAAIDRHGAERGSSESVDSIIEEWTTCSVQDSADRLFAEAKAGRLRKVDFFELAITRKLYPRGKRE